MIARTDFDAKLSSLNRKITANKTKYLLVENEINQPKQTCLDYFLGSTLFDGEDSAQNYLVFQPVRKYLIAGVGNGSYIYYWQFKGLSNTKLDYIRAPNYSITPILSYYGTKIRVEFNGSGLKQDKVTSNHGKVVNIYIVYEITKNNNISDHVTLENCLFGGVSLTKNADIDTYGYPSIWNWV